MEFRILDTSIVSEITRGENKHVLANARTYLRSLGAFTFSAITWYEVVRGFRATGASAKLDEFHKFAARSHIIPVTQEILDKAADLWVAGQGRRNRSHDADLIIAATALTSGATLVTGNEKDFDWIEGLSIENWRNG